MEGDLEELLRPKVIRSPKNGGEEAIVGPPGYRKPVARDHQAKKLGGNDKSLKDDSGELESLKVKKAWEIAMGPAKAVPMNVIMSYMTGNSLQIIPVMMTLMMFWNPLKAIFTETNSAFRGLETERNWMVIVAAKIVFVLCHIALMSFGIWKFYKMGLIPSSESDWLAWKSAVPYKETSIVI